MAGPIRMADWNCKVFKETAFIKSDLGTKYGRTDCLAGMETFSIGYGYTNTHRAKVHFTRDSNTLSTYQPEYRTYRGYADIRHLCAYGELPPSLQTAIRDFEQYMRAEVIAISTGPSKEQILVK